jgi:hypothetical protein
MEKRIYLACPYSEKDECRRLGGRWDKKEMAWYITEKMDALSFQKWWPEERTSAKKKYYVNEERLNELETTVNELLEVVSVLSADETEMYLYRPPEPAMAELRDEVEDWKRVKNENPEWWALFKDNLDPEAIAFYTVSEDSRKRLIN